MTALPNADGRATSAIGHICMFCGHPITHDPALSVSGGLYYLHAWCGFAQSSYLQCVSKQMRAEADAALAMPEQWESPCTLHPQPAPSETTIWRI